MSEIELEKAETNSTTTTTKSDRDKYWQKCRETGVACYWEHPMATAPLENSLAVL